MSLINFKERKRAGESKNTGHLAENRKVGGRNGAGAGSGRGGEPGREREAVVRARSP